MRKFWQLPVFYRKLEAFFYSDNYLLFFQTGSVLNGGGVPQGSVLGLFLFVTNMLLCFSYAVSLS